MAWNDPGPLWRDIHRGQELTWLRMSKTRVFGLLIALSSIAGTVVTHGLANYVAVFYSRSTGGGVDQGAMAIAFVCSLPVFAVLLVAFCYGLAVLLTGRISTAFTSRESSRTKNRSSFQ
jgi:hypothetical protein